MAHPTWTVEQDKLLIRLLGSHIKWPVIAGRLGKPEAAAISRAGTLGIKSIVAGKGEEALYPNPAE